MTTQLRTDTAAELDIMASCRQTQESPSPPGSDLGEEAGWEAPQSETTNASKEPKGRGKTAPKADKTRTPDHPKLSGIDADREMALRNLMHHGRYEEFLKGEKMRRMKRQDLVVRNKIWQEGREQAWARIDAIDMEKKELLENINTMDAAKEAYNAGNAVDVSEEKDVEIRKKFEDFLNLESNVLDV